MRRGCLCPRSSISPLLSAFASLQSDQGSCQWSTLSMHWSPAVESTLCLFAMQKCRKDSHQQRTTLRAGRLHPWWWSLCQYHCQQRHSHEWLYTHWWISRRQTTMRLLKRLAAFVEELCLWFWSFGWSFWHSRSSDMGKPMWIFIYIEFAMTKAPW